MSWGTCYSGSNNIYHDFPPLMSDERIFTSYDPNNEINERIMEQQNIKSNYDYRMFLTRNGNHIIKKNQYNSCNQCGFCQFGDTTPFSVTAQKYLFKGKSDLHRPPGYEDSDLKLEYISREAIQSRTSSPILTQHQLLKYMRDK